MDGRVKISGEYTKTDWIGRRDELLNGKMNDTTLWESTFEDFLMQRIRSRYFVAIDAIAATKNYDGEGFSIVAIECSLIEFLECLYKGYYYKYPNYYSEREIARNSLGRPLKTIEIFVSFFQTHKPFMSTKVSELAEDFYREVRCGLFHQAETYGNWVVLKGAETSPIVDVSSSKRIVYWSSLRKFIEVYLSEVYKNELLCSIERKKAFIYKFDKICQLD